jgi:hypothetical protein
MPQDTYNIRTTRDIILKISPNYPTLLSEYCATRNVLTFIT